MIVFAYIVWLTFAHLEELKPALLPIIWELWD